MKEAGRSVENLRDEAVTARQIFEHLSPYDLDRVTFQMPDGLPIVAVYIDTDLTGGAIVTVSDMRGEDGSSPL